MLAPTQPSLTHMIQWLKTKEPTREYNWSSCSECLFAQYFDSMGLSLSAGLFAMHKNEDYPSTYKGKEAFYYEIYYPIGFGFSSRTSWLLNQAQWTFEHALNRAQEVAERRAQGVTPVLVVPPSTIRMFQEA